MKLSAGKYTFSKTELKTLKEIAKGHHELYTIQTQLSIKPPLLTYTLKKLQTKDLIKITNKGIKKQVAFSNTKHATLLKNLLTIYDYIDWENILNNNAINLLFQISTTNRQNNNANKPTGFARNTLWHYLKEFKSRGILTQEHKINPQLKGLHEFIAEYQNYFYQKRANELSDNAIILWQHNQELLIRTPKTTTKPQNTNFHKTATSLFPLYNIPLFSDYDLYIYSTTKKAIKPENAILHTLIIEQNNVRYSTLALLLLKKMENQIDQDYLLKEAKNYGLEKQVKAMFEFLQTHIRPDNQSFPVWADFAEKAHEYGVNA
ncbi:MAG: hypothetical protein LBC03_05960 [Nitrososphaerota archaeon]|jgi:hypothetical protein|nr:hypothetical protein [Nitrososphaerota archaeon]